MKEQIKSIIELEEAEALLSRSARLSNSKRPSFETGFETIIPWTKDKFIKDMICTNISYSAEVGLNPSLVNKAVTFIINDFLITHSLYEKSPELLNKSYHCMRLLMLQKWATIDGYLQFITALKSVFEKITTPGEFNFKAQNIDEYKWLTSYYTRHKVSETPFAITQTMEIINEAGNLFEEAEELVQIRAKMKEFIRIVNRFILFFILEDSVDKINLDHDICDMLNTQLKELTAFDRSNDFQEFIKKAYQIRESMNTILNALNPLLNQYLIDLKKELTTFTEDDQKNYQDYYEQVGIADQLTYGREIMSHSIQSKTFRARGVKAEPWQPRNVDYIFFTPDDQGISYDSGPSGSLSHRSFSSYFNLSSSSRRSASSRSNSESSSSRSNLTSSSNRTASSRTTNTESSSNRSNFSSRSVNNLNEVSSQKKSQKK
jgi:hypothetical protein